MHKVLISAALAAAIATPVFAETEYDRKLEKAAADIVAAKMGELRGGFAFDARPVLILFEPAESRDRTTTSAIARATLAAAEDDLAPAIERRISRAILF